MLPADAPQLARVKAHCIIRPILPSIPEQCRLIRCLYRSSIVYLAACGETLNIDFTLPFNEFVPSTCHTRFSLKVSPAGFVPIYSSTKTVFPSCLGYQNVPIINVDIFLSFHGCLCARECFLLVRQRTQICDCACQSATQVAALSSLWPKTTRTSNCPPICLSRGRTKVLHQPKQQSPAGETSPMQSECVSKEQHCCSIALCSGPPQEMSSCLSAMSSV